MGGDVLLEIATPTEADIELAKSRVVPKLRPFLFDLFMEDGEFRGFRRDGLWPDAAHA